MNLALILVDVQYDFWQPFQALPHLATFPAKLTKLLQLARAKNLTIIHTQAWFKPDRSDWMLFYRPEGRGKVPCIAETVGAQFTEFATPQPGELIIQKQTFDGKTGGEIIAAGEWKLEERRLKEKEQALKEISELDAKSAAADRVREELKCFAVLRSRFYIQESEYSFGRNPIIEL
ncbi:MAG TPA: isochorismatase family protein, partial [Xanthomonadales bacterium]|nr:isochorismatase family protein [Xanthomonadales bacterium]